MVDLLDTAEYKDESDNGEINDYDDLLDYLDEDNERCTFICLA